MPYLYGLSQTYGRADAFYAVTHPSLPNYLAFWSGSTQGVTDDGIHDLPGRASPTSSRPPAGRGGSTPRITRPEDAAPAGRTPEAWTARASRGPTPASTTRDELHLRVGEQPVREHPALARFDPSVNVAFVVPNLCNDMHDCSAAQGDAFLRAFLPAVLTAPEWPHTLLVVSFDEGATSVKRRRPDLHDGGTPGLSGVRSSTVHDHYGLLRTIEDIFGLPCLNASCGATPLDEFLP